LKKPSPIPACNPDSLEVALAFSEQGVDVDCRKVDAAAALRPDTGIREARRAENKDRMLRAFHAEGRHAVAEPAVKRTDLDEPPTAHTTTVELTDGTVLRMADIEAITPERAAEITARITAVTPVAPID
jgi:hypothetical protein